MLFLLAGLILSITSQLLPYSMATEVLPFKYHLFFDNCDSTLYHAFYFCFLCTKFGFEILLSVVLKIAWIDQIAFGGSGR